MSDKVASRRVWVLYDNVSLNSVSGKARHRAVLFCVGYVLCSQVRSCPGKVGYNHVLCRYYKVKHIVALSGLGNAR